MLFLFFLFLFENGGFVVRGVVVVEILGKFVEMIWFLVFGFCVMFGNLDFFVKNREMGFDILIVDFCLLCW